MVLPLAALLPVAGATLGGISAYKQSGGDLGATALGSGLGTLSLMGIGAPLKALGGRMAGTALGAKLAPEAFKAQQAAQALLAGGGIKGAQAAAASAGLANPLVQQMAGSNVLAKTLAGLGIGTAALTLPAAAAGLAAGAAGPMRGAGPTAAQTAAGALGYRAPGEAQYGTGYLPGGMGQVGPTDAFGNPIDILGPAGMGQRLAQFKSAETQRDIMRMLNPEIYKAAEATKKADFARQAAMKGIAQNIATRASMLMAAQQAGLDMGATAAQQAGSALTSQYQYQ
jgi:hypothetical protein